MPTKHKVVPLKELLERSYKQDTLKIAQERVQKYLSTFRCRKNPDVKYFITNKSIEFQKKNRSRTYLILSGRDELMGYFSLATKPIIIDISILIEVDNQEKLVKKYIEYGFKYLQEDESGLTQLCKLTQDY